MQQDPLELTKKLIACESVTPSDAGSLKIFADLLTRYGFICEEINRGNTKNLWAKYGSGSPVFLFAGHVDGRTDGSSRRLNPLKTRAFCTDAALRT